MRTVLAVLMLVLVLALGVLEVLASRAPLAQHPEWNRDTFAIWQAR